MCLRNKVENEFRKVETSIPTRKCPPKKYLIDWWSDKVALKDKTMKNVKFRRNSSCSAGRPWFGFIRITVREYIENTARVCELEERRRKVDTKTNREGKKRLRRGLQARGIKGTNIQRVENDFGELGGALIKKKKKEENQRCFKRKKSLYWI